LTLDRNRRQLRTRAGWRVWNIGVVNQAITWDVAIAREIIAAHAHLDGAALPILHAVQDRFGYVPDEALPLIAEALNISRADIYGVLTFYHDFRRAPAGRRIVKVCRAEACQSMGGREAAAALLAECKLDWGQTSMDGALTIEPVYCLGLCAVAPAALVDGEPLGRADSARLIAAAAGRPS
jgi:formate dehydrogenase subunit gamma